VSPELLIGSAVDDRLKGHIALMPLAARLKVPLVVGDGFSDLTSIGLKPGLEFVVNGTSVCEQKEGGDARNWQG
jgi:hypothetical protein